MTAMVTPSLVVEPRSWVLRYFWPLLCGTLLLRVLVDMRFSLVPDEAVYWSWSRHPALGYFDHPPMIAWINWIFSRLIGSTELGVRFPMSLMMVGAVAVIVTTAARIIPNAQGVKWVAMIWLVSPLMIGFATISTPDTPAIFFSTCALASVLRVALNDDADLPGSSAAIWWLLFGLFCGLAFLSKYTTVLLPAAVIASLTLSAKGRRHFRRPYLYLAAILSLLIFSPVIYWNSRHQWASFLFQLHHGVSDPSSDAPASRIPLIVRMPLNVLLYFAGQALLWTPVLFVIGLVILTANAKRILQIAEIDRLLLFCAALPLGVFALASAHKLGEANWPCFAYVPLSLLTGRWIAEQNTAIRAHAVKEGAKLALIFTAVIHIPFIPGVPGLVKLAPGYATLPHSARDLLDDTRRVYGRELAVAADGALVVCNRHQDAAIASFYMPGQPDVWCDGVGFRPTAYDYFDAKPDFSTIDRVLFVGGHAAMFMAKHHYTHSRVLIGGPVIVAQSKQTVMVTK
jgi:4-amino-4-deoxy-L-arabinose transferase-like glycosyltransferase